MKSIRIPRRAFLTGAGGAAVALPFLEAMLPRTAWAADSSPCRYVSMFAGIEQLECEPSSTGAGYTMPAGLADLEPVQDLVTVVSDLRIEGTGPSGVTPPGGKANPHHGHVMKPLFVGWASTKEDKHPNTPSADQIVAAVHGADSHFSSLEYRAQPVGYRYGSHGTISFGQDGADQTPQTSPQAAYTSLFTGFQPTDPAEVAAAEARLQRRLSVLDLVREHGATLANRVSVYDKQRIERHFDEIRDLELRLAEIPDTSGAGCAQLPDPGADPEQTSHATPDGHNTGYSDEDARASVFVDLIHMAFTCDLTRAASLMLTLEQCGMSLLHLWDAPREMHEITHDQDFPNRNDVWNAITSWHAKFYARLVQKLADTPEPTGGTLLDHTVAVFTNSGGRTAHTCNNLVMLIAGRPEFLRMGEHVAVDGAHPSKLYQTALLALGIEQDFGELPGLLPALMV